MGSQTFSVRRPTATTVQYAVSTRSEAKSVAAKTRRALLIAIRLLIALVVLVAVSSKVTGSFKIEENAVATCLRTSAMATPITAAAAGLSWRIVLPVAGIILFVITRKNYTEESLLVIRGLGVQTSTSSPTYLSTASTRFIPTNMIQDILIHEAFKGFEIKFFLAIIVEGEEDVVVVFPNILPSRQTLEEVWRGARACLYETKS